MEIAEALAGRVLAAWVRATAGSHVVLGAAECRRRFEEARAAHPGRKVVLYYWIEDVLPMILSDQQGRGAAGDWAGEVQFVCDDTIGGRVAERLLAGLGRRTLRLRWKNPMERIRDLQVILRSDTPMGIAVDGHGPYGRVGDPFARLVASARAVALPLSAAAGRARRVRANALLAVPRRRSPIAVGIGRALVAEGGSEPGAAALQAALDDARRSNLDRLSGAAVGPQGARW